MYGQFQQFYGQRQESLVRVTGYEGAKAYQMMPNSTVALFDGSEDLMYIKSTDGAGFATIRTFKFEPYCEPTQNCGEYISRTEFDEFRNEVKDYVEQFIPKPKSAKNKQSDE